MISFECYVHGNAIMWRVMHRELRALMNDKAMHLNPMEINDVYEVPPAPLPNPLPFPSNEPSLTPLGRMERGVTPSG
jgi:hypothetical protein